MTEGLRQKELLRQRNEACSVIDRRHPYASRLNDNAIYVQMINDSTNTQLLKQSLGIYGKL